jgi:ABC-2 type transport system permease protein
MGFIGFTLLGLLIVGGAIGFFFAALAAIQTGEIWVLSMLLWIVFLIWQLAPILFEGFSPGLNFREIARYPVSFSVYYLLNCAYGLVDPAAITGLLWMGGIWLGIVSARLAWAPMAAIAFLAFAVFNLFCNRLLMGLLDRFQSSRKGRERIMVFLLLLMLAPQLLQVLTYNWKRVSGVIPSKTVLGVLSPINRMLPPALAAESISSYGTRELLTLLLLAIYCVLLGLLLRIQARKVYLGEIYSESHVVRRELKVKPGWRIPGVDDTLIAIAEKELRYVRQNSRLLVQLIYPFIIFPLMFFGRGPVGGFFHGKGTAEGPLGILAAFLLLSVSNIAYNIFGTDQEGFGRWLLSPVPLEKIIAAKNLAHGSIFAGMYLLVVAIALVATRITLLPTVAITIGFIGLLLLQLSAGNMISAHWPRKIDLTRMSSRTASNAAGFVALVITLPAALLVAAVIFLASYLGLPWLPLVAALVLLMIALRFYFYFLGRVAAYLHEHLEEVEGALTT